MCLRSQVTHISQSAFDFVCFECIMFFKCKKASVQTSTQHCRRVNLSSKPRADLAVRSAAALILRPVNRNLCLGETQGKCVRLTAFSEMREILLWLCRSESFQLRNVTYILCPPSLPPSLCSSAVNTWMLTAVMCFLKLLFYTICSIFVFASQAKQSETQIYTAIILQNRTEINFVNILL